jgi:DNA-binding transcriptional LysR family regulator
MTAKTQESEEPRWDDVRIFLAVHRHGSLGQAARRLGLDTSTVSRRLGALERALGRPLFERARDGLVPKQLTELILPAAEAMEAAHARLTRDASSVETAVSGVVRLSMPPGLADSYVGPALPHLYARYPELRLEIDASSRVLDLARGEADIALRIIRPEGAQLLTQKLLTSPWCVAAGRELSARLGVVRDWNAAPFIAWDRDLAHIAGSRWLARHAPRASVVLRTSHYATQLSAARADVGVLLAPELDLERHQLTRVRTAPSLDKSIEALPRDDLWLVARRAHRDVPRVAAVWEFLRDEARHIAQQRTTRRRPPRAPEKR